QPAAFREFRLRDPDRIATLVRRAHSRVVAFKSLCDSQHADVLLDQFQSARVVWPVRGYAAVAESALRKWGDRHLDMMRHLGMDEDYRHWVAERVPVERRTLARDLVDR